VRGIDDFGESGFDVGKMLEVKCFMPAFGPSCVFLILHQDIAVCTALSTDAKPLLSLLCSNVVFFF